MNWTKMGVCPCLTKNQRSFTVESKWFFPSYNIYLDKYYASFFHHTHKIPISKPSTITESSLFSHHFSSVAFWQSPGQTAFPYILSFPERFMSSTFVWYTKYWLEIHPNINIACKTLTVQKKIWLTTTES